MPAIIKKPHQPQADVVFFMHIIVPLSNNPPKARKKPCHLAQQQPAKARKKPYHLDQHLSGDAPRIVLIYGIDNQLEMPGISHKIELIHVYQ